MEGHSRIYKFEVPQELSDESIQAALGELPHWRLSVALAYRRPIDRFLCAEAYILLRRGLREVFGLTGEFEFEFEPSGKPRIAGRSDIFFSISHCSRCVACIVSDAPVGIDVEDIQYDELLSKKVCNSEELQRIAAAANPAEEFTKLWTMKESFLKMTGQGIVNDLPAVLQENHTEFKTEINEEAGYVLCTAC